LSRYTLVHQTGELPVLCLEIIRFMKSFRESAKLIDLFLHGKTSVEIWSYTVPVFIVLAMFKLHAHEKSIQSILEYKMPMIYYFLSDVFKWKVNALNAHLLQNLFPHQYIWVCHEILNIDKSAFKITIWCVTNNVGSVGGEISHWSLFSIFTLTFRNNTKKVIITNSDHVINSKIKVLLFYKQQRLGLGVYEE
jgi:hypothetical protein